LLIGASFARRRPKKFRATTDNQVVDAQLLRSHDKRSA
jgi:hypothetical protein